MIIVQRLSDQLFAAFISRSRFFQGVGVCGESMPSAYETLIERLKEIYLVGEIGALLGWDQEVMMPASGTASRADAFAWLSGRSHAMATDPELGQAIAACEESVVHSTLDENQQANVREARRGWDKATKLPADLVMRLAKHTSLSQSVWAESRAKNDFATFQPYLETMVKLQREKADCIGYESTPYDALLDDYETGMRWASLEPMFAAMRTRLVALREAIDAAGPTTSFDFAKHGPFPVSDQDAFGKFIAESLGFDFTGGRADASSHPFSTSIAIGDIRFTSRFDPEDPLSSLYAAIHETGHSLYEQGLDPAHARTPRGGAVGLGIHESQSRLWENRVGRSLAYWTWMWPHLVASFPSLEVGDATSGFLAANCVQPSFIRVEADEVTYDLHIMLRAELEKAMIEGDLQVSDLPSAWNDAMSRFFGIVPDTDADGCMQDIHWSMGAFGYFPTYTLGNICAAQLMNTASLALPTLWTDIECGQFSGLLDWLKKEVHLRGSLYDPPELMKHITGSEPRAEALLDTLEAKYADIYGL